MLKPLILAGMATLISTQFANASSDASWDKLFAKVNGSCIGASRMDTPEVSAPVVFDDTAGKIAVLLRGPLGKGKARVKEVNLICLYDKKSGKISIDEYRWIGR